MVLGIIYLATNVLCLLVLLTRKYTRLFPWFVMAQGLTTWQAGVRLCTGESRAWWTPGEALLLLGTCAAVAEALWTSVRTMRFRWRTPFIGGLVSTSLGLVWWSCAEVSGDWFQQFLCFRADLFLGLGILMFSGFWIGLKINNEWPRVDRMHACVLAVLLAGHASLVSWATWTNANLHYRILEMACCGGWVINSGLLVRERRELVRKALRAVQQRLAGRRPGSAEYPPVPAVFRGARPQGD